MTSPRRLRRLAACGAVVTAALSAGACSDPSDEQADVAGGAVATSAPATSSTTGGLPSTSASTSEASRPPTTSATSATSQPATPKVELRGDDIAITKVGAPFREAVEAFSRALGRPSADPTPDTACVHADEEVEWSGFRIARSDGTVSGWVSTRKDIKTPSAVTVGTTVAMLRRVYGNRLLLEPPNPDVGMTFEVRGVNLAGVLSGPASTDTVSHLFNGSCGPP